MRPCPVDRVEGAPAYLLGLGLIRGQLVPVLDAGLLLSGSASSAGRLVSLRLGERHVALSVCEVLGTRAFDDAELGGLPPLVSGAADLVRAMAVLDGRLVEVLESGRLLELGEGTLPERELPRAEGGAPQ